MGLIIEFHRCPRINFFVRFCLFFDLRLWAAANGNSFCNFRWWERKKEKNVYVLQNGKGTPFLIHRHLQAWSTTIKKNDQILQKCISPIHCMESLIAKEFFPKVKWDKNIFQFSRFNIWCWVFSPRKWIRKVSLNELSFFALQYFVILQSLIWCCLFYLSEPLMGD